MKRITRELKPFRIPLIMVAFLGIIYFALNSVIPSIRNYQANKTPIVKIEAVNEHVYKQGSAFRASDFTVKAVHESGKTSVLSSDRFTISPKNPNPVGDYTNVTVTLKGDRNKKAKLKVKNERERVLSIPCGKPERDAVQAVIYSNGELAFEGEGDIFQYNINEFPWKNEDNVQIKSVTFDERITPTSMDYWFSNMPNLTYIDTLPETVESIVGMCSGCVLLENAPEWNKSNTLLDATQAYTNCVSLKKVPALTGSIKNATSMLEGCISLETAPDFSGAASLKDITNIFSGCESLTTATTMPPNVKRIDGAFADCINLKKMPDIPESVIYMSGTFTNNMSLREVKRIPSNVQDVSSCFSGCTKIKGELVVDGSPNNYNGFLQNACSAATLNLTGSSGKLNELAFTSSNDNITVNGTKPVKEQ